MDYNNVYNNFSIICIFYKQELYHLLCFNYEDGAGGGGD